MSKLLIADDDPQNLYLERFLMERRGHQVNDASDGGEAVAAACGESFDLILMDIQMPVLDGLEATRRIKENLAEAPPIIALTARAMLGDREAILAAGCDGYIEKPIDPRTFAEQVEAFLNGKAG